MGVSSKIKILIVSSSVVFLLKLIFNQLVFSAQLTHRCFMHDSHQHTHLIWKMTIAVVCVGARVVVGKIEPAFWEEGTTKVFGSFASTSSLTTYLKIEMSPSTPRCIALEVVTNVTIYQAHNTGIWQTRTQYDERHAHTWPQKLAGSPRSRHPAPALRTHSKRYHFWCWMMIKQQQNEHDRRDNRAVTKVAKRSWITTRVTRGWWQI